ncbi:arf-GAP with coiled-coil, ANK repeat and PH domain-containing protein 2-like, partial [Scleropages formosus]
MKVAVDFDECLKDSPRFRKDPMRTLKKKLGASLFLINCKPSTIQFLSLQACTVYYWTMLGNLGDYERLRRSDFLSSSSFDPRRGLAPPLHPHGLLLRPHLHFAVPGTPQMAALRLLAHMTERRTATIEEVEADVCELESKLDKLVKLCIGMIDAGKAYNVASKHFVHGIQELAQQSAKDEVVESNLTKFAETLQEMINYHTILFDQAQRSIRSQLQIFMKEDLRKFREAKKQFDKVSEEKEVALAKNAQAARNKQHEVEEATNILTATRKCFRHVVLDYVLQINVLQSKRRSEILKSMLSFMYAHLTFFHQGYDLFSELQPLMKQLGGQLDQLVIDAAKEKRDMELKHSTIQQKVMNLST